MIRNIVLFYISIRTILLAFYNLYPLPGFRLTDLVGATFPLLLLFYYLNQNKKSRIQPPRYQKTFKWLKILIIWMIISSLLSLLLFNVKLYAILKQFFKLFSGFAVFLTFPLLFKTKKDILDLTNAFLISTIFPGAQAMSQYLFGANFLGLNADISSGEIVLFEGVYGNHGVFGLISWMGALSIIIKIGSTIGTKNSKKILNLVLFFIFISIGMLTYSRTIFLIMAIIVLQFFILNMKKSTVTLLPLFLLIGFIFQTTPLFQSSIDNIKQRSIQEFEVLRGERGIEYGFHGRFSRWDNNLQKFLNNYNLIEQMIGTDIIIGPHGDYFFWLFKYGIIGILFYLIFLFSILTRVHILNKQIVNRFMKLYATAVRTGILIWLVMAITSTPSFMPDFSIFVIGHASILLALPFRHQNSVNPPLNKTN